MKNALRAIALCSVASLVTSVALAQTGTKPGTGTGTTAPARTAPAKAEPKTENKTDAAATKNIVETAVAAGSFNTLAALLTSAGLVEALSGKGPFTVFAPTDEAFAKLPKETLAELAKPENKAKLTRILTYHVVPAKAMAADVSGMRFAPSLQGQRIDLKVDGGKVMVDRATVTKADIVCSNGVIHVIDSVILPVDMDITQVADKAGKFKTLLAAIGAAGMTDAFKGKGPFTVLAPTDEAFAKLPKGTLEDLLKPENKAKLVSILAAHVVPGTAAYSDAVSKMTSLTTMGGSTSKVETSGGKVMIGGATVVMADVEASNGVIHAIDTVIIPTTAVGAGETTKSGS